MDIYSLEKHVTTEQQVRAVCGGGVGVWQMR